MADLQSKRSHVRLKGPFPAEYGTRDSQESSQTGQATDLSPGGMFLSPPCTQTAGTVLEIRIAHGGRGFVAEGEVVRVGPEGMGVRFLTATELVSRLVLPEPAADQAQVEDTLLEESLGMFRLHYGSVQEFRQDYSRHLKVGGIQIRTQRPPAVGSHVQLRLTVEGSGTDPVQLRGRVVAPLAGGVGVEITNLQSTRQQLDAMAGARGKEEGDPLS